MNVWEFENEEQATKMNEPVTKENCWEKILLIRRDIVKITKKEMGNLLGVSESTISRLERKVTDPTDDFMHKLAALCAIGHAKYAKMSEAEKEKLSGYIGLSGGVATGIGGAIGAVSTAGTVAGLSASGITSGLAAIGGGAMLGGIAVVAAIPVIAGAAGFGLVKGIKKICEANNLKCKEVNKKYEIVPDDNKKKEGN